MKVIKKFIVSNWLFKMFIIHFVMIVMNNKIPNRLHIQLNTFTLSNIEQHSKVNSQSITCVKLYKILTIKMLQLEQCAFAKYFIQRNKVRY